MQGEVRLRDPQQILGGRERRQGETDRGLQDEFEVRTRIQTTLPTTAACLGRDVGLHNENLFSCFVRQAVERNEETPQIFDTGEGSLPRVQQAWPWGSSTHLLVPLISTHTLISIDSSHLEIEACAWPFRHMGSADMFVFHLTFQHLISSQQKALQVLRRGSRRVSVQRELLLPARVPGWTHRVAETAAQTRASQRRRRPRHRA